MTINVNILEGGWKLIVLKVESKRKKESKNREMKSLWEIRQEDKIIEVFDRGNKLKHSIKIF